MKTLLPPRSPTSSRHYSTSWGGDALEKSTEYRAAVGRLSDATGAICRKLRRAGGVGTDLWDTVTRADAYIKAHAPTDAHGWAALRDMLACNVPNPRWAVPGGLRNITNCSMRASQKNGGNS